MGYREARDEIWETKGRALTEVKWGRNPSQGAGPWQGKIPAVETETQAASCLNVRYSVVLIALVLKWIQGKMSRESKRVLLFVTWRSVICKWMRDGIVYQKGLLSEMGCLLNSLKWITKRQSRDWEGTGTWGVSSKAAFLLLHVNSLSILCWDSGYWNPIISINDTQDFRTCKATFSGNGESHTE